MFGNLCKIHRDKTHFIAIKHSPNLVLKKKSTVDIYRSIFDTAFEECLVSGNVILKKEHISCVSREDIKYNKDTFDYIKKRFQEYNIEKEDVYFINNINRRLNSIYLREKRFINKVNFYSETKYWNYFVTFTRDDKKYSSYESWLSAVKRTLSKFAYRRGWRYIFVLEKGVEHGREHLHGIVHIPQGQMVGLVRKCDLGYNHKMHCKQYANINSFFEKFGINDFKKVNYLGGATYQDILRYMTKYMNKSPEKFIYSRGVYDTVELFLTDSQLLPPTCKFNVLHYIVSEDVDIFSSFMNRDAVEYERQFYMVRSKISFMI